MPKVQAESTERRRPTLSAGLLLLGTALIWLFAAGRAEGDASYQGFGATTPGGAGKPVVRVTNLKDSGSGSLREALSQGNRTVVFDVAGDINLSGYLYVRGAFITIDGFTAPPPGITLRNRGLVIRGSRGAHDVIVRGIRVRNSPADGISVSGGAYNVVIDRVSVHGSGDGNIDITENSRDITVSWSIFADPSSGKNMLIKYNPSRVTLHHNLFVQGSSRNPQVRIDDAGTLAKDTTLDMRNNLVWDWDGYGTLVWYGPRANIVDNYYATLGRNGDDALTVDADTARAYVAGNISEENIDLDSQSTETAPFPAPAVDTEDACTAAGLVVVHAGVRPLDTIDAGYLAEIALPECAGEIPPPDEEPPSTPPSSPPADTSQPSVSVSAPTNGAAVSGSVSVSATASDDVGVVGVQFLLNGAPLGAEDVTAPYSVSWDSMTAPNGVSPADRARPGCRGERPGEQSGRRHGRERLGIRLDRAPDRPERGRRDRVRLGNGEARGDLRLRRKELHAGSPVPGRPHPEGRPDRVCDPSPARPERADERHQAPVRRRARGQLRAVRRHCGESVDPPKEHGGGRHDPGPVGLQRVQRDPRPARDRPGDRQPCRWQSGGSLTLFVEDGGSAANRKVGTAESPPSPLESATLTVTYRPF